MLISAIVLLMKSHGNQDEDLVQPEDVPCGAELFRMNKKLVFFLELDTVRSIIMR